MNLHNLHQIEDREEIVESGIILKLTDWWLHSLQVLLNFFNENKKMENLYLRDRIKITQFV